MQMLNKEDLQLAQRVLANERVAFEEFFDIYLGRLYRFCATRIGDQPAVEDIVQVTLQKALRHIAGYRGEASMFTWLCKICRNEIANWRAQDVRRGADSDVPLDDRPEVRAALESLNTADAEAQFEMQQVVQLTLDHLPDQYGKVLEWKYLEGLSVEEIGGRLQLSLVSVQSLLARARAAFRRSFLDIQQTIEAVR